MGQGHVKAKKGRPGRGFLVGLFHSSNGGSGSGWNLLMAMIIIKSTRINKFNASDDAALPRTALHGMEFLIDTALAAYDQ
jgi:hypothetical protein